MKILVRNIKPNPFRRVGNYPLEEHKIEALVNSINLTGWWENVVARPGPDGTVEIAYGHHRREALRQAFGEDAEVELPVKDLDNDTMIRMMADENIAEWAHVFGVEAATIRCVLVAAEAEEISLRPYKTEGPGARSDLVRSAASGKPPYPAEIIAEFLGGNWSHQRVNRCLQVLDKMGDEATNTFSATSPTMATEIVATAEALVQANHKDEEAPSDEAEIKEEIVEKAQELTNAVAQGELSRRDLRGMRGKLPTDKPHPLGKINKKALNVSEATGQWGKWADSVLYNDRLQEGAELLLDVSSQLAEDDFRIIEESLQGMIKRVRGYQARFKEVKDNGGNALSGNGSSDSQGGS